MKTIGFPISKKENEKRRALLPEHISSIKNKSLIFVEEDYGKVLGYSNDDYLAAGIKIANREEILKKDILCDPKIGDAEYIKQLNNQTIFGWVHAVQNRHITDDIISGKLSVYAWEDMYEMNRHVFWRNNEIAGEAAICHAYILHGILPYNTKVAVIGRGNIARGAMKMLNSLGADVTVYDKKTEELLRKELPKYDVLVNAILWDTNRKDHIIYESDLCRMKRNAMIIDISCDRKGGVESSIPTTIESPIYFKNRIMHYVVDHTPSLFYKTVSQSLSEIVVNYLDLLIEDKPNETLKEALIIANGLIVDKKIIVFQGR